jgi:two-component system, response regulator YesN
MAVLSKRTLTEVGRLAFKAFGVRPFYMDSGGRVSSHADLLAPFGKVRRQRTYALHESINLGAPCQFEVVPGVSSWIVALEDRRIIHGGLIGGEILYSEDPQASDRALEQLAGLGFSRAAAQGYVRARPAWPQARVQAAAAALSETFYQVSGWKPVLMEENRLRVQQQAQIAQAMEDQKRRGSEPTYPFEKERVLLSHIRAGDQAGARRVLNEMLGAMYMSSPKLVVLRARAIEMMGYLTRAAVEDSPVMESLIERNHRWMERLIRARDFEELSRVLTEALNDFIEGIYLHGFNRTNMHVGKALDFVTRNYMKPLRLTEIAGAVGLSPCRIAHLVKEHTGKTLIQIVTHARIQNAQNLLEHTGKSCTEIAYEVGYSDQSYFIKHFKRITGLTPARFRRTRMIPPREEPGA